jgi:hypothetical protein
MADNFAITPGAGGFASTDQLGDGSHAQQIKLLYSADGVATRVQADVDGLLVKISNAAVPVSIAAPVAATQSGTWNIGTVATITNPVAATQSGTWNIGTVATITNPVTVTGTVTVNQGTPASIANAWHTKVGNGTDFAGVSPVGANKALHVTLLDTVALKADKSSFAEGTDKMAVAGAVYSDTITADPTEDQAVALRATPKRGLHVNVRTQAGLEFGGATTPINTTRTGQSETRVSKQVALTASQTGITVWAPASGKKFVARKVFLIVSVAGVLTLFDQTDSATTILFKGTVPAGIWPFTFEEPFVSASADNILKYTSGAGLVAEITVHGFEV